MSGSPQNPRVTAFIPAFNAERFIGEAIQSILDQTYADLELLLIDDGSQDATTDVMTRYADDPRVRIVCNLENRGQPWTRNEGLRLACGEYIALLDADDIASPERLQRQVDHLDSHPQIAVLGSRCQKIDNHGTLKSMSTKPIGLQHDDIMAQSLFTCSIHHPTIMARAQSLRDNGYDPAFLTTQDYDLWNRMLGQYHFAVLPERLTFHRRHQAQITQTFRPKSRTNREAIQLRELRALGLRFSEEDVTKHSLLNFSNKKFRAAMGYDMDREHLIWAREWFDKLIAANAQRRIYPEPAFSRIAAIYWASLCRKAIRSAGIRSVVLEFSRSRLKWRLPTGLVRMWWDRRC